MHIYINRYIRTQRNRTWPWGLVFIKSRGLFLEGIQGSLASICGLSWNHTWLLWLSCWSVGGQCPEGLAATQRLQTRDLPNQRLQWFGIDSFLRNLRYNKSASNIAFCVVFGLQNSFFFNKRTAQSFTLSHSYPVCQSVAVCCRVLPFVALWYVHRVHACYGVVSLCWIDQIICLCCKRAL